MIINRYDLDADVWTQAPIITQSSTDQTYYENSKYNLKAYIIITDKVRQTTSIYMLWRKIGPSRPFLLRFTRLE